MRSLIALCMLSSLAACGDKPPPLDATTRLTSQRVTIEVTSRPATRIVANPRWPASAVRVTTNAQGKATLEVPLDGLAEPRGRLIVNAIGDSGAASSMDVWIDAPPRVTWSGSSFDCGEPTLCSGVVVQGLALSVTTARRMKVTWLGVTQEIDGKGTIEPPLVPQLQGIDLAELYADSGAFQREHPLKLEYDNVTLEVTARLGAETYRLAVYHWAHRAHTRGVMLEGEAPAPPGKPRAALLRYEWDGTSHLIGTAHTLSDIDLVLVGTKASDLVSCGTYVTKDGRSFDLNVTSGNLSTALYRRRDGTFVGAKNIVASGRCPDQTLATVEYGRAIGGGIDPSTAPLEQWVRSHLAPTP